MLNMYNNEQKQTSSLLLEDLPNELLIEILSYLNGTDGIFAFSCLNNRFESLINEYCQIIDFKLTSKTKFDFFIEHHDSKRWKILRLSNDFHTPGQIEYFSQFYSFTNDFPKLQSLSMLSMEALINYDILSKLPSLTNLTSLTIESVCARSMSPFHLPTLKQLIFTSCRHINWIKNFSGLETLEYTITTTCCTDQDPLWPSTLKRLKVVFKDDEQRQSISRSLNHLSQLITLELYQETCEELILYGQIWERLIRSSFPSLKNFKFYFRYRSYPNNYMKQMIASFSTPFYVHEKRWIIRCDRYEYSDQDKTDAAIYSLPFAFDRFTIWTNSLDQSLSTLLNINNNVSNSNIYRNIKTLLIENQCTKPDENFNRTNVINLIIRSYFDSMCWVDVLSKLRHLEIESNLISSENFSHLLANTPHLYSLTTQKSLLKVLTENWSNVFICNHLSDKIRSLKLYSKDAQSQFMSRDELNQIVSIFARKCQHLSICLQSQKRTIGFILQNMSQLCSLRVYIIEKDRPPIDMLWLLQQRKNFNHSNCYIVNNGQSSYFWLDKHS